MVIDPVIVNYKVGDTTITLEEWLNPSTRDVIERAFVTVTELGEGVEVFPFHHDSLIEAVEHACDQSPKYHNAWSVVKDIAHLLALAHDRRGVLV